MKTTRTVAVFHVSNLDAALKYYQNILGFTLEFQHEGYAGLKMGQAGLHLMQQSRSGSIAVLPPSQPRDVGQHVLGKATQPRVGLGTAYFFCDEVDSYYGVINSRGALVKGEPQEYFYGMRDFIVADPDGNHLSFGCPGASR